MATFVSDTFTDTAGDDLVTAHTGEVGATYSKNISDAGDMAITDLNRARVSNAGTVMLKASGTPASAEYDVVGTIFRLSTVSASQIGVCGRAHATDQTYYAAFYDADSGAFHLYKRVTGTYTSLGTAYTTALTIGQGYELKLEIRDATKRLYVDGVQRISSTDNAITATGKAGLFGVLAVTNSTGYHIDSFTASDPAVGGPSPAVGALAFAGPATIIGKAILMPAEA